MKNYPFYIFIILIFLSSCTATLEVQKRRYQNGYHIDFSIAAKSKVNTNDSKMFLLETKKEIVLSEKSLSSDFTSVFSDTSKIEIQENLIIPTSVNIADTTKCVIKKWCFFKAKSDAAPKTETTHKSTWPKYLLWIGTVILIAGLLLIFSHFIGEILAIIGLLMIIASLIGFACRSVGKWQRYLSLIGFVVELIGMILVTMFGPFGAIVLLFGALIELSAFICSFVSPKWKNVLFTGLMLLSQLFVLFAWALYSSGG